VACWLILLLSTLTCAQLIPLQPILLRDAFYNPIVVADGVDNLVRGMMNQHGNRPDTYIADDMRHFLFGRPGGNPSGVDMVAITIQRGRDEGVPFFNDVRAVCSPRSFACCTLWLILTVMLLGSWFASLHEFPRAHE
jgi:hypothetical protein